MNPSVFSFKSTCQAVKGTVLAACPHQGSIGGCETKNTDQRGNDDTDWYYGDANIKTSDDVKATCVAPPPSSRRSANGKNAWRR